MKKMLKRCPAMLLAVLIVMTQMAFTALHAANGFPPAGETPLNGEFKDQNFLKAVIEAADTGEKDGIITYAETSALTNFTYTGKNLQDLSGIQYLTGLTSLDLSNNLLQNLEPLSGAETKPNLTTLNLSNNKLQDIAPISTFTTITNLDISGNPIEETGPIGLLTNLKSLNMSDNKIKNAGGLHFTTKLETLDISNNLLIDSGAFETLTNLKVLNASNNNIVNGGGLHFTTKLETLDISNNAIIDSGAFDQLSNLKTLDISNNKIVDIGGLASTKPNDDGIVPNPPLGLTNLNLSGNAITDIGTVESLKQLSDLNLSNTQVADITPLLNLSETNPNVSIDLTGSKVAPTDISRLEDAFTGGDITADVQPETPPSKPGGGVVSFTITIKADGNGTASSSYIAVPAGYTVTLEKTPNSGYEFDKWEGNVEVTGDSFIMPYYNVELTAVFKKIGSDEETPAETEDVSLGAGIEETENFPLTENIGIMVIIVISGVVLAVGKKKEKQ